MSDDNSNAPDVKQFGIQKIYTRDLSFETPNSPQVFMETWEPTVNVDLSTNGKRLNEGVHEVVLTITVTTKIKDKTAYLAEVQQAGIFNITGLNDQELSHAIGSFCPGILFPYARETISDLVQRGGFPQMILAPVNFDALYQQHLQQRQQHPVEPEPVH
jgi:preprotein translocase subunit SecB